ncbi:MAG: hypothetical protein NVSMB31_14890 [Vulcanimicrobiaceae bacterium]
MQIVGFGAQQLAATPQAFQSLSIGGAPPSAPVNPFGTPNANLVPVKQTATDGVPLNLTLQALPAANAIAALQNASANATVTRPPVTQTPPNSTAFVAATVPNVQQVTGHVTPPGSPPPINPPASVSFTLAAPPADQTSAQQVAQQSLTTPPPAGPSTPPPPYTLQNSTTPSPNSAQRPPTTATPANTAPPAAAAASVPATANPSLVQQVVSTVQSLLIGKAYPQPIFSFLA